MDEFTRRRGGLHLVPTAASDALCDYAATPPRTCSVQSIAAIAPVDNEAVEWVGKQPVTEVQQETDGAYELQSTSGRVTFRDGRVLLRAEGVEPLQSDLQSVEATLDAGGFDAERTRTKARVLRVVVGFSVDDVAAEKASTAFETAGILPTTYVERHPLRGEVVCYTTEGPTVRYVETGTILITELSSLIEAAAWTKRTRLALSFA